MGSRRSSKQNLISGILIAILVILIFFVPSYGSQLRAWLSPGTSTGSGSAGNDTDAANLAAQNESLQAQLAEFQMIAAQLPTSSAGYVRGMVYSRYPFNFKNELSVNVGSGDGINIGAAAVFQGILIGQVKSVTTHDAVVQTIFDNGLKMPVRIGSIGADGLLQGGSYPTVGSISNSAPIQVGDIVYSAAPGLPYGLPIGTVASTSTSPDSLFQQAAVNFTYDINTIQTVLIAGQ